MCHYRWFLDTVLGKFMYVLTQMYVLKQIKYNTV